MKRFSALFCMFMAVGSSLFAQGLAPDGSRSHTIDRKALVQRHNPLTTDSHGSQTFLLGNGSMAIRVDASALQTFTSQGWNGFRIGLNLNPAEPVDSLSMTLDRWRGKAESRFRQGRRHYHVETVCAPAETSVNAYMQRFLSEGNTEAAVATRISCDSTIEIIIRPAASATLTDQTKRPSLHLIHLKSNAAIRVVDANGTHWLTLQWRGKASIRKRKDGIVLSCKQGPLDVTFQPVKYEPRDAFFNATTTAPFTDYALRTAQGWNTFWTTCGMADFSDTGTPEARLTEQHMVEVLYQLVADSPSDWWQQAPLTLWGFSKQLVPKFSPKGRRVQDTLYLRPEFIAAAEMMLRGYTHPLTVERNGLSTDEVSQLRSAIIHTYAGQVARAARHLQTWPADSLTPPMLWLDRDQLLAAANRWQATADSLSNTTPEFSNNTTPIFLNNTAPDNLIFRLPPTIREHPETLGDFRLLLTIAAHWWPSDWQVKTENILPLP